MAKFNIGDIIEIKKIVQPVLEGIYVIIDFDRHIYCTDRPFKKERSGRLKNNQFTTGSTREAKAKFIGKSEMGKILYG